MGNKQHPSNPEHPSYLPALGPTWFLEESTAFNASFPLLSLSDESLSGCAEGWLQL